MLAGPEGRRASRVLHAALFDLNDGVLALRSTEAGESFLVAVLKVDNEYRTAHHRCPGPIQK
jgi:hypothetical protein